MNKSDTEVELEILLIASAINDEIDNTSILLLFLILLELSIESVIIIFLISLIISGLASYLPVMRITNMNTFRALRYE